MRWFQFILSHSIFIAFCAVALALQTSQLLHFPVNGFLCGFIFFATLCSYNAYWLLSKYALRKNFSIGAFLRAEITEICILIFAGAGLLFCLLRVDLLTYNLLPAILFTALYALPLLPFRSLLPLRRAGALKTLMLAFTWTYVTGFIPLQKHVASLTGPDMFVLTRRFLFMLMLCIIFDSRDVAVDKIRGLHSLATDLSPRMLRILNYAIFLALFATNFFCLHYGISLAQSIALQVSTVMLLGGYYYSTRKQGYLFYYFFIDGMMLFSALTTYIASI